ncbi:hypothetical protein R1flu_006853 [Riccia fluitans]|uniref:Uncharacterized protein n=1 Tax=Riccia fluitans TaxID=41844 RepID=A0ABD1YX72_9MARC
MKREGKTHNAEVNDRKRRSEETRRQFDTNPKKPSHCYTEHQYCKGRADILRRNDIHRKESSTQRARGTASRSERRTNNRAKGRRFRGKANRPLAFGRTWRAERMPVDVAAGTAGTRPALAGCMRALKDWLRDVRPALTPHM